MTAVWIEWWPLITTMAFALTTSLWAYWALNGDALYAALLSIPASCGMGALISMAAGRRQ